MYVHVDVKERHRPIGWAADLCPICRDLRTFEVSEVRRVARVYFFPIGQGALEGREITCIDCGSVFESPKAAYESVSKRRRDPSDLVERTNPGLLDRAEAWFEKQRRVATGALNRRERIAEIGQVLRSMEHMAWTRMGGGSEELLAAVSVVIFVALLVGMIAMWSVPGPWRLIFGTGAGVMLLVSTVLVLTHRSIAAGRQLVPRLARALEPLEPEDEEVDTALALARRDGLRIARYVSTRQLMREMSRERSRPVVIGHSKARA